MKEGPNMKAFLSLTLSLLMLLSLAPGIQCQAGAVAPPEPARLARNTSSQLDDWTIPEGNEISEEAISALEQALEGCSDVDYQPVALLGTQQATETNYCFLCRAEPRSPSAAEAYPYAAAKENTVFNGFELYDDADVQLMVKSSLNPYIRQMLEENYTSFMLFGIQNYLIDKLDEDIFLLSEVESSEVAALGTGELKVGTYDLLNKEIRFTIGEIDGLLELASSVRKECQADLDGITYSFKKASRPKTFDIYVQIDGLHYFSEDLGPEFEITLHLAAEADLYTFLVEDELYFMIQRGRLTIIYRVDQSVPVMIYTRLCLDCLAPDPGNTEAFTAAALQAAALGDGTFSFSDHSYTASLQNRLLEIKDEDGSLCALMAPYRVFSASGEEEIPIEMKRMIHYSIILMAAAGVEEATVTYTLPRQNADGTFVYDGEGQLQYEEEEMTVLQQQASDQAAKEYIINRKQAVSDPDAAATYALIFVHSDPQGGARLLSIVPLNIAELFEADKESGN